MTTANPNVVMTADAIGGIWTYALDLGRELVRCGFGVTLAILGPGLDDEKRRAAADAGLALSDLGVSPEWLASGPEEVVRSGEALAHVVGQTGADLIHLNHPALAGAVPFDRPVLAACHSCVATWWETVRATPLPDQFRWQADLVGRGYRAARTLVAPSRAFAEATQRTYGLDRQPEVVHNGRAPNPTSAVTERPIEAAFTAGRFWDEGKNVRTLDRIAALTMAPFRAAGPLAGPNGAVCEVRHLEALGPLSEDAMRRQFAERPIYVTAALYEPFGLAVLEAAQAGCALVLSDIDSLREVWGDAALFVAPTDEEGFAAAIGRLLSDNDLRSEYEHAARNRARAFGLEAFVGDMINNYESTLAARNGKDQAA